MPSLKTIATQPTPASADLNLPPDFPPIPQDVIDRFDSVEQWMALVQQWYNSLSQQLNDNNAQQAGVMNGNAATIAALQATVSALLPNPLKVALLPALALDGQRGFVTDANGPTFGAPVVGGGAIHVPVYYDLSNGAWYVG